jgi:hypothetical protein
VQVRIIIQNPRCDCRRYGRAGSGGIFIACATLRVIACATLRVIACATLRVDKRPQHPVAFREAVAKRITTRSVAGIERVPNGDGRKFLSEIGEGKGGHR